MGPGTSALLELEDGHLRKNGTKPERSISKEVLKLFRENS